MLISPKYSVFTFPLMFLVIDFLSPSENLSRFFTNTIESTIFGISANKVAI